MFEWMWKCLGKGVGSLVLYCKGRVIRMKGGGGDSVSVKVLLESNGNKLIDVYCCFMIVCLINRGQFWFYMFEVYFNCFVFCIVWV